MENSSLVSQLVNNPPSMWETWVQSLGWEDPLEEGMATHSSIPAWRIPWTEEPGGLQFVGQQRVRQDWGDLACVHDPAIPLLGTYAEKTAIEKDTCTPMFMAAPFTTARTREQPRCPSADELIEKLWHIYTVEYFSAIKRNECESVMVRWMNL